MTATSNQIAPDEIQVYGGSSAPAAPALLGVLTDGVSANFHLKCLTFEGKTVQTRGYVLRATTRPARQASWAYGPRPGTAPRFGCPA